jgi:hypothetical protein
MILQLMKKRNWNPIDAKNSNDDSWRFRKPKKWIKNANRGSISRQIHLWSLGGTYKNVIPQMFLTHPTSRQHKTNLRKVFPSNFYIKRLTKLWRIWNFDCIYKKNNFIIPMEWSREKFKKVTFGVPFFMNKKKDVFSFFL